MADCELVTDVFERVLPLSLKDPTQQQAREPNREHRVSTPID